MTQNTSYELVTITPDYVNIRPEKHLEEYTGIRKRQIRTKTRALPLTSNIRRFLYPST